MLESWKHCVARGWTEAAAAKAEAKKKRVREISFMKNVSGYPWWLKQNQKHPTKHKVWN